MSHTTTLGPRRRLILTAGIIMVALSFFGYATVADDFRHVGEFMGVSSLLLGGLALIGDAFEVWARWLVLRWVAVGVVAGAIVDAALDVTPVGFGVGLAAGIVVASLRAKPGLRARVRQL